MKNVEGEICWHEWMVTSSFVHAQVKKFTVMNFRVSKNKKVKTRNKGLEVFSLV